jgi:acyl-CoA dehydrogenase
MIRDPDSFASFLQSLRRFVRETLVPAEEELAQHDAIPASIVAAMGKLGLFGLSTPEEYGGLGLTMEEEVSAMFELCQTAPAYRALCSINIGSGSQTILKSGTPAQREKYLRRIASGELITALAVTEPEAGSDPASMQATARREANQSYVLDGVKCHVSNAPEAGLILIYARTGVGPQGISAFLVERGTPGLVVDAPDRKMGLAGMHSSTVHLRSCHVPADSLLGGAEGGGLKLALAGIDKARLNVAAVCVGLADRLLGDAARYAMGRKQFGQPIADFQLIQAMLADSNTELYGARSMTLQTAQRRDAGEEVTTGIAACKYFASEALCRIADRAVQIHGGSGYIRGHAVERLYRDARLFRLLDGTSQIQQLVIARNLLKRERERQGVKA